MARNLGRIEDRLAAAIRYNVIYGDRGERSIMEGQVMEAIEELRLLRSSAAKADRYKKTLEEIRDLEEEGFQSLADQAMYYAEARELAILALGDAAPSSEEGGDEAAKSQ